MANLIGIEREQYVQAMFARIAPRYDLMNRLMSAGQDIHWRQEVIRRAGLAEGGWLLDLGAGTGDLAFETLRQSPHNHIVAMDFTLPMMQAGLLRPAAGQILWSSGNAQDLPFPDDTFDAVVSGFLLRNVRDLGSSLEEQRRVLKPGGRLVTLDTTRPRNGLIKPLVQAHMHILIPTLGRLISGHPEAYLYLPDSTEEFLPAEVLAARLMAAGFKQVGFHLLMFGSAAIHWGMK
jgi:demethylmenaquinone methyltransferase/2-methoxy-6-polyprenyl-1,4-benzoquinol methylase